ncbi:hypothetical protein DEA06_12560 [Microbacterium sp. Gd 4-13]|uniref:FGGY-family carbohydrate kinase n=1 Tax=Microbacterium sp. Gd 4-13 TaxID=2173179 RepID=UPI000D56FBC9|nr:FGGY family carbohydrate kinase [Microbacterium sp. Gd 4-13]PVW03694.1 hypothetical protein DEA06_12560 [Microbacterium sp. Gd 4-13]
MLPTITVDVGTTSVKLCLFDAAGDPRATSRLATPTTSDRWGEVYDLAELTAGIERFVLSLGADERATVRRIAITGVGESGGLVRGDMSMASPMILWHDHRGSDYLARLGARERRRVYEVTGLPINANYGLSKVAWAVAHADDVGDAQWLNVAEYLAGTLTGDRWSEYSLASRTMALDLGERLWSAEIVGLVGLDTSLFPSLRAAVDGSAITADAARRLGLGYDVTVHVAGHDHMVGGAGADLQPGELLNSTGTTEGLLFVGQSPRLDETAAAAKLANGIDCGGEGFTLFASIPTGGSAFATLQGMLSLTAGELTACVDDLARRYARGAIDLDTVPVVLPQFRGSPPPDKNAAARGVIAGVRSDTTTADIVLGCFLGMALQFRDVLGLFEHPVERVKVIGPAAVNPLWLQLKADLLGVPLSVSRFPEVVSRGAQALASGEVVSWARSEPREVEVDPANAERVAAWATSVGPRWEHMKAMPW